MRVLNMFDEIGDRVVAHQIGEHEATHLFFYRLAAELLRGGYARIDLDQPKPVCQRDALEEAMRLCDERAASGRPTNEA